MVYRKYTLNDVIEAVEMSTSIANVLRKIGLKPKGGNYRTINNYIKENDIDVSHFTGQLWSKGKIIGPKRDIGDYLSNKYPIQSNVLKKRLINEGLKEHKCEKCGNIKWLVGLIPLELHHINGNSDDNSLNNLQLLCPNCHAFTDNYRGRKLKKVKLKKAKINKKSVTHKKKYYCTCGNEKARGSKMCSDCQHKLQRKVRNRPNKEILLQEVKDTSYTAVGKKYGVSDNTIRKWITTLRS